MHSLSLLWGVGPLSPLLKSGQGLWLLHVTECGRYGPGFQTQTSEVREASTLSLLEYPLGHHVSSPATLLVAIRWGPETTWSGEGHSCPSGTRCVSEGTVLEVDPEPAPQRPGTSHPAEPCLSFWPQNLGRNKVVALSHCYTVLVALEVPEVSSL